MFMAGKISQKLEGLVLGLSSGSLSLVSTVANPLAELGRYILETIMSAWWLTYAFEKI